MIEEGYAWPGTLVVASDSHSNVRHIVDPTFYAELMNVPGVWGLGRSWGK